MEARPRLRPVETIVVPDPRHKKVLVLRDTQGVARGHAVLPPALIPIVARFTGEKTCAEIARDLEIEASFVIGIAEQLDESLFLEGETFERALDEVRKDFASLALRPASHAGGAYHGDRVKLVDYIDRNCIAAASSKSASTPMRALVAPHIDPWRGAVGYGHAYGALARALAKDATVDTFVVLGTSHAPMREPFALCNKGYDTPLGAMPVDEAFVHEIEKSCAFDPYTDELNHKREHSIEFQAVFLRHVLGKREARIVPILAGLGEEQATRKAPRHTRDVAKFLDGLREAIAKRGKRVIVIAGADMAHVGPRFGDAKPHDAPRRAALEQTDRASLDHATKQDAPAFWDHVASDLEARRVCGLAPIFSMLDVLPEKTSGEILHYEQNIDDDDGSIVSFASVAFH